MERAKGLGPASVISGPVRLPCSKSIAQRALVAAALASGTTRIRGLTASGDVRSVLHALAGLSVRVDGQVPERGSGAVTLQGCPPGPQLGWTLAAPESAVDPREGVSVGESGTGARLLAAAAGLCGRVGAPITLHAEGTLRGRSSSALLAALKGAGVGVEHLGPGPWPLSLRPIGPPSSLHLEQPRSSQELSALLIACAAWPGEFHVDVVGELPSAPYARMTAGVLGRFGVLVTPPAHGNRDGTGASGGNGSTAGCFGAGTWRLKGPLRAPDGALDVEPDASAAAVAAAAACLSGGELFVPGLSSASLQGDVAIAAYLRAFGCAAELSERGLSATGRPRRGADLDLAGEPDLAPVLAAVAAVAARELGATSRLRGLETLPGKESSRIEVLAEGLARVGLEPVASDHDLVIGPPRSGSGDSGPVLLDPHDDHRMAFAFALLGLAFADVRVSSPACVAKSWPGFWDDLRDAGARIH